MQYHNQQLAKHNTDDMAYLCHWIVIKSIRLPRGCVISSGKKLANVSNNAERDVKCWLRSSSNEISQKGKCTVGKVTVEK